MLESNRESTSNVDVEEIQEKIVEIKSDPDLTVPHSSGALPGLPSGLQPLASVCASTFTIWPMTDFRQKDTDGRDTGLKSVAGYHDKFSVRNKCMETVYTSYRTTSKNMIDKTKEAGHCIHVKVYPSQKDALRIEIPCTGTFSYRYGCVFDEQSNLLGLVRNGF